MRDRRQHIRVAISIPVSCEVEGDLVFDGLAQDISLGGSRIQCATSPIEGARLTIVVQLPGALDGSRLPATVRWCNADCFGVQFGLLSARDTYRIVDVMGRSIRAANSGNNGESK
jgi:hypothetical protein